jgi:hypothetical protein
LDQRQQTFITATSTSAQKAQVSWYPSGCTEVEPGLNVTGILFEELPDRSFVCGTQVDKLFKLQEPQMLIPEVS